MSRLAFFDTNIFLYADDDCSPVKQMIAIDLITEHQSLGLAVLSLQVLQEYYSVATRKLGVSSELAQRKVEIMSRLRMVRFQEADVLAAIEFHRLHRISFWDGMIVHAARISGASLLYSEDLQHGSTLGDVTIVNPFA